jgi:YHS domain-containing protein
MQLQDVLYYVFFAGVFFVMMRFGCGAHIMGHGHHKAASATDHRGTGIRGQASVPDVQPDQVTDPVCGMSVKTCAAKTSAYLGHVYYFCSQTCREKFEAAPEAYAKAGNVALLEKEHQHGCC